MKIIDLNHEDEKLFFLCLEDWSDEAKEAGDHREKWYGKMKDKGLRAKLAVDDNEKIGGMIQYVPVEHSFVNGEDLYFINCIWVHGYKEGRGNFQKHGMGTALLEAAEEDARELGVKGIAAWGIPLPFWMKASWYKKHGYKKVDHNGFLGEVLLWKPFTEDAVPPELIKRRKKPERIPGKVAVTAFTNGWCLAQNLTLERAKRATEKFGSDVVFQQIDTFDRRNLLEWGISDALYVDGKEVPTGPPPTYEKIRKIIAKRVKKL
ncbi:GNAT family N-acetyltransferase [Chloroflexota bacterium]